MALPVCAESFVRGFFLLVKLSWDGWFPSFWVVAAVFIVYFLKRSPWMVGAFGFFLNLVQDLVKGVGAVFGAGIIGGIAGTVISLPFALMLGVVWGMMVLVSPANLILKIFAFPMMVVLGALWGVFPIPLPLSVVFGWLFSQKRLANMLCLGVIVLTVLLAMANVDFFCTYLNSALKAVSSWA